MEAFVGEVRIFSFTFAPSDWAKCDGATLEITQFQELFAIVGIIWGGNGRTNFRVPDLRGLAVCGPGQGPGPMYWNLSQRAGQNMVTLTQKQIPGHQHTMNAVLAKLADLKNVPGGDLMVARTANQFNYTKADVYNDTFYPSVVQYWGNGDPHENCQPFLALNFCICLFGTFPAHD